MGQHGVGGANVHRTAFLCPAIFEVRAVAVEELRQAEAVEVKTDGDASVSESCKLYSATAVGVQHLGVWPGAKTGDHAFVGGAKGPTRRLAENLLAVGVQGGRQNGNGVGGVGGQVTAVGLEAQRGFLPGEGAAHGRLNLEGGFGGGRVHGPVKTHLNAGIRVDVATLRAAAEDGGRRGKVERLGQGNFLPITVAQGGGKAEAVGGVARQRCIGEQGKGFIIIAPGDLAVDGRFNLQRLAEAGLLYGVIKADGDGGVRAGGAGAIDAADGRAQAIMPGVCFI